MVFLVLDVCADNVKVGEVFRVLCVKHELWLL